MTRHLTRRYVVKLKTPLLLLCCTFVWMLTTATATRADQPAVGPRNQAGESSSFENVHVVKMPIRTKPRPNVGYRGMVGDIVVLKDNRLLLSYVKGSIQGRISADRGKTWGNEFILVAAPKTRGNDSYAAPSFLRLSNGQLLMSYFYVSGALPRFAQSYYRRSIDDGRTWGDQLIMTPHVGYILVHNDKPIQLSSGRLIAPYERELTEEGGDHRGYVSSVFYSDDNGYSWHKSKNEINVLPIEAQEPHVVELKDERLMMLCRTYSGFVVRAYSSDQGTTWTKGQPVRELKLSSHSSALNVKRIPGTGDLLLLRSTGDGTQGLRSPFVSVISKDEGQTWIHTRAIGSDPDNDYGYPCLTFVDDMALISYHQRDGLHVARISIEWFYEK